MLVIVGLDSEETLERWTFNVHKEERPVLKDGRCVSPLSPRYFLFFFRSPLY